MSFFMKKNMATDEIKIAVLETNMTNIAKDIVEIKAELKAISVMMQKTTSLEAEIIALKTQITEIKKSSNLWKWLAPTLTGLACTLLTGLIMFLLIQYLQGA